MNPGSLRHRVKILNPSTAQSTVYGNPLPTWVTTKTVWANVRPLSGREYYAANQTVAEINTIISMRYTTAVKPASRIMYGDYEYRVESIINVGMSDTELQIMAKMVAYG